MGENTLTINTLDLIKSASVELDKAQKNIKLLAEIVSDKKKHKKIHKSMQLLEATNIAIKSLENELK